MHTVTQKDLETVDSHLTIAARPHRAYSVLEREEEAKDEFLFLCVPRKWQKQQTFNTPKDSRIKCKQCSR